MFLGHALATRVQYMARPAGIELASFTLITLPHYFYPYYTLLAVGGAYHLVYGLSRISNYYGAPIRINTRSRTFRIIAGTACLAMLSIIPVLGGIIRPVEISRYLDYAKKVSAGTFGLYTSDTLCDNYLDYAR